MAQAADALGVTVDAIRSRIKRGTIAHVREGERVYVVLGDDQVTTSRDQGSAQYADQQDHDGHHRDELVEELRNRVRYLEEESRRKDAIIMTLAQRVPELEGAQEPREAPQTPAEDAGRSEPRTPPEGAQEVPEARSWWRRFFGFE